MGEGRKEKQNSEKELCVFKYRWNWSGEMVYPVVLKALLPLHSGHSWQNSRNQMQCQRLDQGHAFARQAPPTVLFLWACLGFSLKKI